MDSNHRVFGAILLIAGCCIGAGMLGLPMMTISAGFLPSSLSFIICWAFMAATGLLLLEANLWFGEGVHLMTLAERTLGKYAKMLVGFCFSFLFYCLLVAYFAGGGSLIAEFAGYYGMEMNPFSGALGMLVLLGAVVVMGTSKVDLINRYSMLGLALSYGGLVLLGSQHVNLAHLENTSFGYAFLALPAMVISFGYHNLIPSLTRYLNQDRKQLRLAILIGSAIPLIVYLIWDAVILGIIPAEGLELESSVNKLLKDVVGTSYVVDLMHIFAFFALITSFLGVSLSFVDFLADGLKVRKGKGASFFLTLAVLLPPCLFAYFYPSVFIAALNYAGAFGAVFLFGIFPVLMVWKGRYIEKRKGEPLVFGGKIMLLLLGAFSLFIFLMQLKIELQSILELV